mgnify:CR=1 FL=1
MIKLTTKKTKKYPFEINDEVVVKKNGLRGRVWSVIDRSGVPEEVVYYVTLENGENRHYTEKDLKKAK